MLKKSGLSINLPNSGFGLYIHVRAKVITKNNNLIASKKSTFVYIPSLCLAPSSGF
jgi:hypothetical protein